MKKKTKKYKTKDGKATVVFHGEINYKEMENAAIKFIKSVMIQK